MGQSIWKIYYEIRIDFLVFFLFLFPILEIYRAGLELDLFIVEHVAHSPGCWTKEIGVEDKFLFGGLGVIHEDMSN